MPCQALTARHSRCDPVTHEGDTRFGNSIATQGLGCGAPAEYGSILVRDRNTPVATLTPVTEEPAVNLFERWKPLKKFSPAAIDRPVGARRSKPSSAKTGIAESR